MTIINGIEMDDGVDEPNPIPICLCCKHPLDDESIEAGEHSMCQNVCPVCGGHGKKECDVETTTGTVKQYDGPCAKCGGTGLVKPSASARRHNDKVSDPRQ